MAGSASTSLVLAVVSLALTLLGGSVGHVQPRGFWCIELLASLLVLVTIITFSDGDYIGMHHLGGAGDDSVVFARTVTKNADCQQHLLLRC